MVYTLYFSTYQRVRGLARIEWPEPSVCYIHLFMHLCIYLNHLALVYIPTEIPVTLFIHLNIYVFTHSERDREI